MRTLVTFRGTHGKTIVLNLHKVVKAAQVDDAVVLIYGTAPKLSYFGVDTSKTVAQINGELSTFQAQYPKPVVQAKQEKTEPTKVQIG